MHSEIYRFFLHSQTRPIESNHFRLRLHSRISVTVRNGTFGSRIDQMRHRHTQYHRQSIATEIEK